MFNRIARWFAGIVRAEVMASEERVFERIREAEFRLLKRLGAAEETLHATVSELHDKHDSLKDHVTEQVGVGMIKRYDQIVDDAARAAYNAVHEARKTLRLPCSMCGQLTWKFAINEHTRRPVCLDCQQKETRK